MYFYGIINVKTREYYASDGKGWCESPFCAKKFRAFNLFRFVFKKYIEKRYNVQTKFKRLLFLDLRIDIRER